MSHETRQSLENDGYRALVFTPWPAPGPVLLQPRRGSLMQARFPDLMQAAEQQLPDGLFLDGELIVWAGDDHDGRSAVTKYRAHLLDVVGVLAQLGAGSVTGDRFADAGVAGDDDQGAVRGVDVRLAGEGCRP
ncbi:hypothetical protein ACIQ6Y_19330 [Streptomyces sp. NPDC096205]|uniref:hypothetical protein n=1 Tax=Streptomyces sp. NPDC096205 TaxID=3366081 RepID=UPI003813A7A2